MILCLELIEKQEGRRIFLFFWAYMAPSTSSDGPQQRYTPAIPRFYRHNRRAQDYFLRKLAVVMKVSGNSLYGRVVN